MNLPIITDDLVIRLGPEVEPFERFNKNQIKGSKKVMPRVVLVGEKSSFDEFIIDYVRDGCQYPQTTNVENLSFETRYLWIINKEGLFLILENTPNLEASRGVVCHSNITKGEKALQGGELWFISSNYVVINFKSGRYGAETIAHEEAVREYFELLGFEVKIQDL